MRTRTVGIVGTALKGEGDYREKEEAEDLVLNSQGDDIRERHLCDGYR